LVVWPCRHARSIDRQRSLYRPIGTHRPFLPDPTRQTHLPYLATPSHVVPAATVMVDVTVTLVQEGTVRADGAV